MSFLIKKHECFNMQCYYYAYVCRLSKYNQVPNLYFGFFLMTCLHRVLFRFLQWIMGKKTSWRRENGNICTLFCDNVSHATQGQGK